MIMVMDRFSHGQVVQHSVIEVNVVWHISCALEHFQAVHPLWTSVRDVVLDKDFNEIGPVKRLFPNATVLLCHFHVAAYIRNAAKFGKHGRFSSGDVARLNAVIAGHTAAWSDGEYERMRSTMLLPCRHVMCCRCQAGELRAIPIRNPHSRFVNRLSRFVYLVVA